MASLSSLVDDNRDSIVRTLRLCKDNWAKLLRTCETEAIERHGRLNNEATWTFLAACGYAIAGRNGVALLTEKLTGRSDLPQPKSPQIWLEYRPMTPRVGEGRTHLDLAIGSIQREGGTKGGIELDCDESTRSWICFCETKWESDIALGTANDDGRNQLVRVIESALYFQNGWWFAEEVYVGLVTPAVFGGAAGSAKLYHSKFSEYKSCSSSILRDLDDGKLTSRNQFNAAERIGALSLRWATFDDLYNSFPASRICFGLREFWSRYGNYLEE